MHFINVNVTANFGPNVCEVEWDFTLHDFYKNMVLHRDLGFFNSLICTFLGGSQVVEVHTHFAPPSYPTQWPPPSMRC